ncbi:MAG: PIN domain-containing protein [Chitinispirillales bacterium]|jgi:PIN domain nuclease of toxin-antitoxin system|nr:PIN domain-containing protein [Chitinispirillales bacterium]
MRSERYLIDSNIVIYLAGDPELLTAEVEAILRDTTNHIYVPSKCVEELILLQQTGKIEVKRWKSAKDIIGYITNERSYKIKYVMEDHLWKLAEIPIVNDHRDNTDRIIIAQAIVEKIPIISSDRQFPNYRRYGLKLVYNKR